MCFLFGIPGSNGNNGIPEQIEISRTDGVVCNQQEEEIIPVVIAQRITREPENQHTDDNGHKTEDQVPWTHTTLAGFCVLHQPAIDNSHNHRQQLCYRHDDLIIATHFLNHGNVLCAIHGTCLLGEEFLHQCRNGVYHKNQSKRSNQMSQDPLFFRYRSGLHF